MQVSKANGHSPFKLIIVSKTKLKIIQFILDDLTIGDLCMSYAHFWCMS